MKRAIGILAAAAVLAVGAPTLAAGHQHAKTTASKAAAGKAAPKKPAPKKPEVRCPVMGGRVKDIKTAPKSVYKGKTYYFCCSACKPKFDKEPEKYIKKTAPKK